MLANEITVTDGTTPGVFDLISREGTNSIRRQTGVDSDVSGQLNIKNTVDLSSSSTKKNRHLAPQFIGYEKDATTGEISTCTVHTVIVRDKAYSDEGVALLVAYNGSFLG